MVRSGLCPLVLVDRSGSRADGTDTDTHAFTGLQVLVVDEDRCQFSISLLMSGLEHEQR